VAQEEVASAGGKIVNIVNRAADGVAFSEAANDRFSAVAVLECVR
jgi:hypothetical protein